MGFPQLYTKKPSGFAYNHPQNPAEEASVLNSFYFFSALQDLKEEIDIRLSRVQDIKYEPRLLAEDDSRLLQLETQGTPRLAMSCRTPGHHPALFCRGGLSLLPAGDGGSVPCLPFAAECCRAFRLGFLFPGCYNYLYRMKALDAIRTSGKRGHGRREREGGRACGK